MSVRQLRLQRFIRSSIIAIGAFSVTFVSASSANGAGTGAIRNGPPWSVRIAIAGTFSNLMAADGSLYATRGSRTQQLIRIEPSTGRIEAAGNRVTGVDSVAYAGKAIWTTGVPTARPAAPYELVEFNPITLARERAIPLGSEYKPFVFAGPDGELWSGTGDSQVGACVIRRLSPVTGATEIGRRLSIPGTPAGGCSGVSFSPDNRFLYVITGSGGTGNLVLYKLDAVSLQVVADRTRPGFADFATVEASDTRVWLAGGYPGTNGDLLFLDGSNLRILAESPDLGMSGSRISTDLPEFSLWPDLSRAAGRIWIASEGTDACFAPSSRRTLAIYTEFHHRAIATGDFTESGGKLWALGQNLTGTQGGLLVVVPPTLCTSRGP
jgi:hypothetical protein